MKKILFVIAFCFLVLGCAAVKQAQSDFALCMGDDACKQKMLSDSKTAGTIGQTVGSASGIPVAGNVAGSVMAAVALLISGIAGGAALRKKKEGQ